MSYTKSAQKYLDCYANNLNFFEKTYPGIYAFFSNYKMSNIKVDILEATDEIDILHENRHVYGGNSVNYAKREVATFLNTIDINSNVNSIRPLKRDTYKNPRLFSRLISEVYQDYYKVCPNYQGYRLDGVFPLLIFMGVGLAKHIDILTQIREIDHVIIFETNMDLFAASLYSVSWSEIIGDRLINPDRSFEFVLVNNASTEQEMTSVLWDKLIELCPIFPVTTFFYNHLGNKLYDRISDKVNNDILMHLFSFGNTDDENNQLSNAFYNLKSGISLLPNCRDHFEVLKELENIPICIVGSGPSVDNRIDEIRFFKGKALIVSCGTAISALLAHQITPDIHIELESDYFTYKLQSLSDVEKLNNVNLIGAVQLNPHLFNLFGKSRIFFKEDGVFSSLLSEYGQGIPFAAPTCTNAALAIALYLGTKNIFFFGMDFGFQDRQKHHAQGSVYFNSFVMDEYQDSLNFSDSDLMDVESVTGGTIKTTSFLHAAKRRVEIIIASKSNALGIRSNGRKLNIYNCSEGAIINGSEYLNKKQLKLISGAFKKIEVAELLNRTLFFNDDQNIKDSIDKSFSSFLDQILFFIRDIETCFPDDNGTISVKAFTRLCYRILKKLSLLKRSDIGHSVYYFIRGSIWHFLLAGYTHIYSLYDQNLIQSYYSNWQKLFRKYLNEVLLQTQSLVFNQNSLGGDMFDRTIWQLRSSDLIALDWQYQGYKSNGSSFIHEEIKWEFTGRLFDGKKYVKYQS